VKNWAPSAGHSPPKEVGIECTGAGLIPRFMLPEDFHFPTVKPLTTSTIQAFDSGLRGFVADAQSFASLLWESFRSLSEVRRYRKQVNEAMLMFGADAAWLVILSAIFIGLVLALEWGTKLEPFGAKLLMGRIVAIAVIREIGPIITGLMVAGRTGAKMAAELGSMKVTDQIDAVRAMGHNPVARLVLPRQIASTVTMLPLTLLASSLGVVAGWFVAVTWLNTPSQFFWSSALESLTFKDLAVGLIKPCFFGYFIASISAWCGMNTKGGSSGVGTSATKAVMYSMLSVLILDFVLGKLVLALFG
jgi:phospholipid/cholesterol/gamma-HCH transport system permease protein